jgi:PDZ domain-containing protein
VLRRLLTPLRLASAGLVILVVAVAILVTRSSNHFLEIPDKAHPLAGLVRIPGSKNRNDGGGIYYVDVLVKRASLLESLLPLVRPNGSDLVPVGQFLEPGISQQERVKLDASDMRISQLVASTVALRQLGYKIPVRAGGVKIVAVTSDSHAGRLLKPGDVIVSAEGKKLRTSADLRVVLAKHVPGDVVTLGVRRGIKLLTISVKTTSDASDPKRPLIGFLPSQALDVHFPFPIRFNLGDVGGPSAGLAFALELLEKRGRDVDHGYRVAATGEIQLDGSVTRIGGVKQKTIGARQAQVDVFLVPKDGDNAKVARRYAHGLRIIPVENLQQALRALATLPRKS